jgi:hypothetical protein
MITVYNVNGSADRDFSDMHEKYKNYIKDQKIPVPRVCKAVCDGNGDKKMCVGHVRQEGSRVNYLFPICCSHNNMRDKPIKISKKNEIYLILETDVRNKK